VAIASAILLRGHLSLPRLVWGHTVWPVFAGVGLGIFFAFGHWRQKGVTPTLTGVASGIEMFFSVLAPVTSIATVLLFALVFDLVQRWDGNYFLVTIPWVPFILAVGFFVGAFVHLPLPGGRMHRFQKAFMVYIMVLPMGIMYYQSAVWGTGLWAVFALDVCYWLLYWVYTMSTLHSSMEEPLEEFV